ncbi:MAG: DUF177 domain-containing protein [Parvibaculum sp.]|uniref:DUF177 domain-containing protein n=1 Tax=Parvibaculum sp. TaxID=2024848 RepID=UPI002722A91F|nr:DUF177 domain-containing protein [Parvibaculum sp.]MDO8840197.1 DUF177 domain-containing protein [Parvibaculum sp.]
MLAAKDVPAAGTVLKFDADAATCAALARRFNILELQYLRGTASVRPFRKHGLTLDCRFEAVLVQSCVVTLDPVVQKVEESFTRRWLPEHLIEPAGAADGREILIEAEGDDAPDPMTGGAIDIGEAVAEALALAIDPYPRKPGVAYDVPPDVPDAVAEERPNPFAALEKLKKND